MRDVSDALARLRGGLIVSVQAEPASLLDTPETIALLARCAVQNGAAGVRIEGAARIAAVRAALDVPIVGIIKRVHAGFEPYITSTPEEVAEVAAAGADVVAFDATARSRAAGTTVAMLAHAARTHGMLAMADCAASGDLAETLDARVDIVATTLAGYTAPTRDLTLPAFALVAEFAARHPFTICEGGIASPDLARRAFSAGARAIVVGTAITNVDARVRAFAAASVITGDDGRTV